MTPQSCVLEVGGADSHLVDALAARGLDCLAVLDVSGAALERARTRMGAAAHVPVWVEADVTGDWTLKPMDIWHDRAVFHVLTTPQGAHGTGDIYSTRSGQAVQPSWRPSRLTVPKPAVACRCSAVRQGR